MNSAAAKERVDELLDVMANALVQSLKAERGSCRSEARGKWWPL